MITHISITTLAGIARLDLPLPAVALITGGNGRGKTSFLAALRLLADRGHDASLIHGSAEWGEVIATTDTGHQLRAYVTHNETTRGWKSPGGKRWVTNRQYVDSLARAIAYDPVKFLELPPREQAEQLLKLAPIEVSAEEIQAAVGEAEDEAMGAAITPGMSGLDVINATHGAIYTARRDIGRDADIQQKHATALEATLPKAAPAGDWTAEVTRLRGALAAAEQTERDGVAEVRRVFDAAKSTAEKNRITADAEIDRDIEAKIAALRTEQSQRKSIAAQAETAALDAARAVANTEAARVRGESKPVVDALKNDLATAEERARVEEQAVGTRKAMDAARTEATGLTARVNVCTAALERLAALKAAVAGRLRIPGVRVEGGLIVREEAGGLVPLDRWNTADQITLGLRIGMLIGAGVVIFDNAERFDKPHREALMKAAQRYSESGQPVQFIIASVDPWNQEPGDLRVEDAGKEVRA